MANLMLSVMGVFAELERSLIRERQRDACLRRKKSMNAARIAELKERVWDGESKELIAHDFEISRETMYQ